MAILVSPLAQLITLLLISSRRRTQRLYRTMSWNASGSSASLDPSLSTIRKSDSRTDKICRDFPRQGFRTGQTPLMLWERKKMKTELGDSKRKRLREERSTPWSMSYKSKLDTRLLRELTNTCTILKIKLRHSIQKCYYVILCKKETCSFNLKRERLRLRDRSRLSGKNSNR